MARVDIQQVAKIYPGAGKSGSGNVRAVDSIDLHIADREFVVLVGPSGCGKSTTIRMVAGLEEISEGQISICAHTLRALRQARHLRPHRLGRRQLQGRTLANREPRAYNVSTMRLKLVSVGNSRGVRLPKSVLEEARLTDEIELHVSPGQITLTPANPREGWEEALKGAGDKLAKEFAEWEAAPLNAQWEREGWKW